MDLDAGTIVASLLVSAVGFVFFSYGKSMKRMPQMIGGLTLMIYPYFVPDALGILLSGALISGLIWFVTRRGA